MKNHRSTKLVLLFLAFVLLACHQTLLGVSVLPSSTDSPETSTVGAGNAQAATVNDFASFVDTLSAEGAEVSVGETLSQPFFDVVGQIIRVNGEDVQVFEFADEAATETAASQISPDGGSTTTTMITWIATPHFYRVGKVIVLYVGDNEDLIVLLNSILGPQFAGG